MIFTLEELALICDALYHHINMYEDKNEEYKELIYRIQIRLESAENG